MTVLAIMAARPTTPAMAEASVVVDRATAATEPGGVGSDPRAPFGLQILLDRKTLRKTDQRGMTEYEGREMVKVIEEALSRRLEHR